MERMFGGGASNASYDRVNVDVSDAPTPTVTHRNDPDRVATGHIAFPPHTDIPMSYPPSRRPYLRDDASSSQSHIPLASDTTSSRHRNDDTVEMKGFDPERGAGHRDGMPQSHKPGTPSWDILGGIKQFEHSYEQFDTRNASEKHLTFAEGDIPNNKLSKLYHYLLSVSIITRWFLFIVPVLGMLWIPGILQLTKYPNAKLAGIQLKWWSIWWTVVWGGWWAALALSRILPPIIRSTIGVVAVGTRRYIDWAGALHRYVALFIWTLVSWATWNALIDARQSGASDRSIRVIDILGRLWFAFFICAAVLLFEKFSIQWIAGKFHERSYAERIADQKFAVKSLVTLYRNSSDIPGRSDTLKEGTTRGDTVNPKKIFKKAIKGFRAAATTTTTVFGNVASEIAGSSVLQPNSPQAVVKTALESANKSRLLARRLFYSFAKPGSEFLFIEDIARFFQTREEADQVFALFDRDSNGDASREEVEMACMDFHREQLSIEHSMQDLDSAVGRLDNILMSVYVIVAALIIAVALEAQLSTLVTGAGTLVLGLSWLIGGSLTEVLTSIIFLFVKHPFDVGDRVDLEKASYTVKEIRLLSTIFLDSHGVYVQAPNVELNSMFIQNIRRSPQMSETFTFNVGYTTSFEDLEKLRDRMLAFLSENRRDFLPIFDVAVVDFPEQDHMTLSADIKYKSNSQQGGLKAKRRNKWICQLKTALAEVPIYGPKGNPDATPLPKRYTEVPWREVKAEEAEELKHKDQRKSLEPQDPRVGWRLSDKNAALQDDADGVYGEADEVHMTSPRRGLSNTQPGRNLAMPIPMGMPPSSDIHGNAAPSSHV